MLKSIGRAYAQKKNNPIERSPLTNCFCFMWQVVIFRDGKYLTLREVFESLDLTG
jgi:hypothetical protein